jgi:hypothetical protein
MALLIGITVVLALAALALGWHERLAQPSSPVANLGPADRKAYKIWVGVFALFVVQAAGVAASFYLVSQVLKPQQSVWPLSLILAAASFGGGLAARGSRVSVRPAEIFQFFKDGLLWPATLPTLAKVLNVPTGS